MALINARLSQNSVDGWRNKRKFARQVFSCFDIILPADELTHNALKFLGGNVVSQIGNLKTAMPALDYDADESARLKSAFGRRPVWLVASTHGPEEAELLKAHELGPHKKANALLVWVPRHPERGDEIKAFCESYNVAQRSKGEIPTEDTSIYLMDTLGEMGLALDLANAAFVGGSLHPSLTGHNPLEPARARVPILTGPHVASFTSLYEELFNHNAAIRVKSAKHLSKSVMALLTDHAAARQMAERARLLAEESDSVLDYTVAKLRGSPADYRTNRSRCSNYLRGQCDFGRDRENARCGLFAEIHASSWHPSAWLITRIWRHRKRSNRRRAETFCARCRR